MIKKGLGTATHYTIPNGVNSPCAAIGLRTGASLKNGTTSSAWSSSPSVGWILIMCDELCLVRLS